MLQRALLQKSRLVWGTTTVVVGGGAVVALQDRNHWHVPSTLTEGDPSAQSRFPSSSSPDSVLIPTLEAVARAGRLVQTAVLIAADYKRAEWRWRSSSRSDSDGRDEERRYWEAEKVRRLQELEDSQAAYAKPSHTDTKDLVLNLKSKEQQRQRMHDAADQLAQAEETLDELGSSKSLLHRKAATRLLELCRRNKGVYIKIGQHLANLDYLIPQEYIDTLSSLFDDTPRTDFRDVCQVIREELQHEPDELFARIDPVPIASASLAQVHVAYDKTTGRKLAIKVQHRGLRETCAGDLHALVTVAHMAERLFQDFQWGWIADEIAPQLPKELDFINEGRNAERAAADIRETGLDCIVPKILWQHSSARVLTMEFEEGFRATDIEAIEKAGLRKHDVAKLISSVFSSQAFISGWVHCDPHPANVLLRKNTKGKPQMVLVDHGLYRELDTDFRLRYASLWKGLMLADLDGIKQSCRSLGIDEAYTLFAAMLTARPFDEIIERSKRNSLTHNVQPNSRADQAVIRGYAQRFLQNIFELLNKLPRQMLLLLKVSQAILMLFY